MRTVTVACFCAFFLLSCSHDPGANENFALKVMQPADVEQLKNVEASLTLTPEKAAFSPDHQIIENVPVPNLPEYRLGPADVVEIVYHIRYESTGEPYRLDVQDKISVTLPYYPRFSTTVLVVPKTAGTIHRVKAAFSRNTTRSGLAAINGWVSSRSAATSGSLMWPLP